MCFANEANSNLKDSAKKKAKQIAKQIAVAKSTVVARNLAEQKRAANEKAAAELAMTRAGQAAAAQQAAAELAAAELAADERAADETEADEAAAGEAAAEEAATEQEAEGDHQADGGSASWLSKDKEKYNKWAYRANNVEGLKAEWQAMQAKSEKEQREFVDRVVSMKPKGIKELIRTKRLVRDQAHGTTGRWMAFKEAADKDGKELIEEYLKVGTMVSKRNPKLPGDSAVKSPWNLVVAYESEVWHNMTSCQDSTDLHQHDLDPRADQLETAEQNFNKEQDAMARCRGQKPRDLSHT